MGPMIINSNGKQTVIASTVEVPAKVLFRHVKTFKLDSYLRLNALPYLLLPILILFPFRTFNVNPFLPKYVPLTLIRLNRFSKSELFLNNLKRGGVAFAQRKDKEKPNPTVIVAIGGLGCSTLNTLKRKFISTIVPLPVPPEIPAIIITSTSTPLPSS